MDPVIAAALIAMISGVLVFLMTLRGNRGSQMQAAGDSLRDDLLVQAIRQDGRIERLEARIERQDERAVQLESQNSALRAEDSRLHAGADDDAVHIDRLVDWGTNDPDPVPRTPPRRRWPRP